MSKARPPAPFIAMLFKLINDPETDDAIRWTDEKNKFEVCDSAKLKTETLKKHYTAKYETFRRQLYFYGFKSHEKDRFWSHAQLDKTNSEVNPLMKIS